MNTIQEKIAEHHIGVISLIRYRFGRTKGVLFKPKQLGERGVRWNDLLSYDDGERRGKTSKS